MSAPWLLLLPALAPYVAGQVHLEPALVRVDRSAGGELWTVRASLASPAALLKRVAELSEREIDSTTALERSPRIDVCLDRRPLEQVLEYALGGAGLRGEVVGHTIVVRADDPADDSAEERLALAAGAWANAAARFPRHPDAAGARLAQGELAELRGRDESARARYLDVLEHDPASSSAPEAYLRAGRIAAERGDWSEASEHFRALANLENAEEYHPIARLELARATRELGDAEGALHILDALARSHPAWDRTEVTARELVRIETLIAAQRFQEALAALDAGERDFDALGARQVPRLRAQALEGAGLGDEAARAWLVVAREKSGPARIEAYRTAAQLALDADDALGVLFVAREASAAGLGSAVAAEETEARRRLGLAPVNAPAIDPAPAASARLARAELWLATGEEERAATELDELERDRDHLALAPGERARLVLARARLARSHGGLAAAVELARAERSRLDDPTFRRGLDLGIARLFEEAGDFERAADADQGEF